MKKRYLFVTAAILAAGLVFSGCDLFSASGNGGGETAGELTITGVSTENRSVKTIFSTTRGSGGAAMTAPETGDTYRIVYDNKDVSKGSVEVRGNIVTFKPSSGASFDAILGNSDNQATLNFPRGITASDGTNIGYVNHTAIDPVFTTDLDEPTITLSVGQTRPLAVIADSGDGGTPSYQWYKTGSSTDTGTPIQGATSSSYTVSASAPATTFYYVMVTNASGGFKNSKVVKVQVGSAINIAAGGSGVSIPSLPDVIKAMLGSSPEMPYTVTFAEAPDKPLLISDKTFPGTGKVTINSTVPFTTGILITRSNVELNGLNLLLTDSGKVPKLSSDLCAVLISKQYDNSMEMLPEKPGDPDFSITSTWKEYSDFTPNKTINNVEIVKCNISFVLNGNQSSIHGIYVDPFTSGRTAANRVKIKNTTVYVTGNPIVHAFCFSGNLFDLSDNTFTNTNKDGVVNIYCIFDLYYGGSNATISFTNNQFNASKESRIAYVTANAWLDITGTPDYYELTKNTAIGTSSFGKGYDFSKLPSRYQNLIKDLFDQAPSTDDRYITLEDVTAAMTTTPPNPPQPSGNDDNYENYFKVMGNYSVKPH